jgi:hypothetical protein
MSQNQTDLIERLVQDAFNDGFTEGMREYTTSNGGRKWNESRSKERLADALQSLTDSGAATVEWYKCSDAVPPISEAPYYVLVSNGYHIGVGYRSERYDDDPSSPEWCEEGGDFIEPAPTHWAYLPKPPPVATPHPARGIAEPGEDGVDYWAVFSASGTHVGLWEEFENAKRECGPGYQLVPLVFASRLSALEPSPVRAEAALTRTRDSYEVANQLEGYVGPNTPKPLAEFLMREGKAAAALADEVERLRGALQALVDKLDECEEPINDAFKVAHIHGFRYSGPTYDEALAAARAALSPAQSETKL